MRPIGLHLLTAGLVLLLACPAAVTAGFRDEEQPQERERQLHERHATAQQEVKGIGEQIATRAEELRDRRRERANLNGAIAGLHQRIGAADDEGKAKQAEYLRERLAEQQQRLDRVIGRMEQLREELSGLNTRFRIAVDAAKQANGDYLSYFGVRPNEDPMPGEAHANPLEAHQASGGHSSDGARTWSAVETGRVFLNERLAERARTAADAELSPQEKERALASLDQQIEGALADRRNMSFHYDRMRTAAISVEEHEQAAAQAGPPQTTYGRVSEVPISNNHRPDGVDQATERIYGTGPLDDSAGSSSSPADQSQIYTAAPKRSANRDLDAADTSTTAPPRQQSRQYLKLPPEPVYVELPPEDLIYVDLPPETELDQAAAMRRPLPEAPAEDDADVGTVSSTSGAAAPTNEAAARRPPANAAALPANVARDAARAIRQRQRVQRLSPEAVASNAASTASTSPAQAERERSAQTGGLDSELQAILNRRLARGETGSQSE